MWNICLFLKVRVLVFLFVLYLITLHIVAAPHSYPLIPILTPSWPIPQTPSQRREHSRPPAPTHTPGATLPRYFVLSQDLWLWGLNQSLADGRQQVLYHR